MQYWTVMNIYYINKYEIVEVSIFFKSEFEMAEWLSMLLAIYMIICEIINNLFISFMSSML